MQSRSAVIVIMNDPARTGRSRPLALELVMGTPLLRWLTHALADRGVERWLLVCPQNVLAEARLCFPEGCELTACADRDAGNPLHVFLSSAPEEEEQVLVLTGACVCLPPEDGETCASCACQVRCDELMAALDEEDFSFSRFLLTKGSRCSQLEGVCAVSDLSELPGLSERMHRAAMLRLAERGVQVWDAGYCHVDPGAVIGTGTVLMPGTVIRGATVIGSDCVIGPGTLLENAHVGSGCRINSSQLSDCRIGNDCAVGPYASIRSGSLLGDRVLVGSGTELSCTELGEATRVGALCALRELTCGRSCIFGAGVICTGGRVTVAEEAFIGGGTTLADSVSIGRGAVLSPGMTVTRDVPPQTLASAKVRQSVRKDRSK